MTICADNAEKKICADNAEKMAVYADNAATTRMSDAALSAMLPYLKEEYGNPSSLYAVSYTHLTLPTTRAV